MKATLQENEETASPAELFDNGAELDRRVKNAIRAAVADHKRAGDPFAVWRDGRVVLLPADQIELPDLEPQCIKIAKTNSPRHRPFLRGGKGLSQP